MKVYVNDQIIEIFQSCRAIDAILKFRSIYNNVKLFNIVILDEWGNQIAEDSPLQENEKIYLQKKNH